MTLSVSYTALTEGETIDLTANGTLDWIKFGNGETDGDTSFLNTTKIGNPIFLPATSAPLGTNPDGTVELAAFSGGGALNFLWTDGNFGMWDEPNPVDTVVTQVLSPPANEYPIGLGATFDAQSLAETLVMDVYVQGFNSDMVIMAKIGGLTESVTVTPTINPTNDPNNDYALGLFRIEYSGQQAVRD